MKTIKVFYWRPLFARHGNFGDELGPILIRKVFGKNARYSLPWMCDLLSVGSILDCFCIRGLSTLHYAVDFRFRPRAVWGTGYLFGTPYLVRTPLNVAAVRGKHSLALVNDTSGKEIALGDPGLLVDRLFDKLPAKTHRIGIVPHHSEQKNPYLHELSQALGSAKVIRVLNETETVLREIAECEVILSSSLHGLIVADALGIPNRRLVLSELSGGDFKFTDYYSVFDIDNPKPLRRGDVIDARTISEIEETHHRPGLEEIKHRLIKSFPFK